MFTVGINVGLGGGNCGLGPIPAEIGNSADSPHAVSTVVITEHKKTILGYHMALMLSAYHFPATVGTCLTRFNTFVHIADFLAIGCARFANLGANFVEAMLETRATQLEIRRGLANLGTVHHQTEMFGLDVLSAGFQAMIHSGLQANLMATRTSLYAGLHSGIGVGRLMHGVLQRKVK
ncbi:hypothetical protein [Methylotuvimicrobium alcaliphilum]|uniref:hypothetical protein n=1 Tax=Methylotuvimicrobium alcaliphilum TaxID=271065 RepID=UPI0018E18056|nr:hypothetical protein [Methylotuvimicrobium alcaliphilum]